jgi:hypothetical protein
MHIWLLQILLRLNQDSPRGPGVHASSGVGADSASASRLNHDSPRGPGVQLSSGVGADSASASRLNQLSPRGPGVQLSSGVGADAASASRLTSRIAPAGFGLGRARVKVARARMLTSFMAMMFRGGRRMDECSDRMLGLLAMGNMICQLYICDLSSSVVR